MSRAVHVRIYHEADQAKLDQAAAASATWLSSLAMLQSKLTAAVLARNSRHCAVIICECSRLVNRIKETQATLEAEVTTGVFITKPSFWQKLVRTTFYGDRVVAGGALASRSLRRCFDPTGRLKPGLVITRHT